MISVPPLATRCLNLKLEDQQQTKKTTIIKQMNNSAGITDEIDAKSNAWFNYLLDKAANYPTTTLSLSSSPLSPSSHQESCLKSQNSNSIETSLSSNSIQLYRSLNTSNTIFVQPTDI